MKIPIVVGFTGHRDIYPEDITELKSKVREELLKIREKSPNSNLVVLNSLAEGADQLCAEVALDMGIPVIAVLPMDVDEYRKDFIADSLGKFNDLLGQSAEVFVTPEIETGKQKNRDYYYRQAGIYVSSHSHILIALWDGSPAKPTGCGTAEIVGFTLNTSYGNEDTIYRAMRNGAVLHIKTRRSQAEKVDGKHETKLLEKVPGFFETNLKRTDTYNKDAILEESNKCDLIFEEGIDFSEKKVEATLSKSYSISDKLSLKYRNKYLRSMFQLSLLAVILVLLFLFFGQTDNGIFLLLYGMVLVSMITLYMSIKRKGFQSKYLEYRVFAETIRVQYYLEILGINKNICDSLTWPNYDKNVWIRDGIAALLIGVRTKFGISPEIVKTNWIDRQIIYHRNALEKDSAKDKLNSRITKTMLIMSVATFILTAILKFSNSRMFLEVIEGSEIAKIILPNRENGVKIRDVINLTMGLVSATTVFMSNYYGKLSLQRKISDHKKMIYLYTIFQDLYENHEMSKDRLFFELARESVVETGDWLTYCRDQSPSINV
ncbi:hypothetical protein [Alkalibacter mobilis]|uniref:hypothetical protein n=1 Tax=Alkalibacter mobilis TaxID=2787712 RepID=UPI00189F08D9|nr:hypothetical protein [Alkalibacter mobilis]MBF7097008.1 hypothetical protein [Alkalibacter mobilis]